MTQSGRKSSVAGVAKPERQSAKTVGCTLQDSARERKDARDDKPDGGGCPDESAVVWLDGRWKMAREWAERQLFAGFKAAADESLCRGSGSQCACGCRQERTVHGHHQMEVSVRVICWWCTM